MKNTGTAPERRSRSYVRRKPGISRPALSLAGFARVELPSAKKRRSFSRSASGASPSGAARKTAGSWKRASTSSASARPAAICGLYTRCMLPAKYPSMNTPRRNLTFTAARMCKMCPTRAAALGHDIPPARWEERGAVGLQRRHLPRKISPPAVLARGCTTRWKPRAA